MCIHNLRANIPYRIPPSRAFSAQLVCGVVCFLQSLQLFFTALMIDMATTCLNADTSNSNSVAGGRRSRGHGQLATELEQQSFSSTSLFDFQKISLVSSIITGTISAIAVAIGVGICTYVFRWSNSTHSKLDQSFRQEVSKRLGETFSSVWMILAYLFGCITCGVPRWVGRRSRRVEPYASPSLPPSDGIAPARADGLEGTTRPQTAWASSSFTSISSLDEDKLQECATPRPSTSEALLPAAERYAVRDLTSPPRVQRVSCSMLTEETDAELADVVTSLQTVEMEEHTTTPSMRRTRSRSAWCATECAASHEHSEPGCGQWDGERSTFRRSTTLQKDAHASDISQRGELTAKDEVTSGSRLMWMVPTMTQRGWGRGRSRAVVPIKSSPEGQDIQSRSRPLHGASSPKALDLAKASSACEGGHVKSFNAVVDDPACSIKGSHNGEQLIRWRNKSEQFRRRFAGWFFNALMYVLAGLLVLVYGVQALGPDTMTSTIVTWLVAILQVFLIIEPLQVCIVAALPFCVNEGTRAGRCCRRLQQFYNEILAP